MLKTQLILGVLLICINIILIQFTMTSIRTYRALDNYCRIQQIDMNNKDIIARWLGDTLSLMSLNEAKIPVEYKTDDMGVLFTARVPEGSAGSLIGRQGQNVRSVREVLKIIGKGHELQASLKLEIQ